MTEEVVEGTVSRVEVYGLYADTSKGPAIVLLPDISREKIEDLRDRFHPRDRVELRMLYLAEDRWLYKASMLDLS
ncbi:MAG: S1 RNA-binding domain-containing protein [bacterium]|nr:S1 RNA-binding domain-containing protein [bacterium]